MATQVITPLFEQLLDELDSGSALNQTTEPDFLRYSRQQARESFRQLGFPTTRVEDWKYTNLAPFLRDNYNLNTGPASATSNLRTVAIEGLDCYRIELVNGELQESTRNEEIPAFIKIRSITEATQDPAFQKYFNQNIDEQKYHFAAINTAMFHQGVFIEVSANAHLDKPLHIVHTYTGVNNLLVQPRHLIIVHRSASLSIVESIVTDESDVKILVNSLSEVIIEENANLDHYYLQRGKKAFRQVQHTEVSQKRDSVYSNYTFSLPAAELLRNNLNVNLDDSHTESHLYGLYLAANNQLVDNHTFMNHKKPHCESNEIYKGVLLDNSTGVFNGKVYVHQEAQKTNAFQKNNNLLLSPKATINSKPQLEIFADDVKCSHGSTIGQLSPEALFYLKTRGIGDQTAKAMLVNAFAFDVTAMIKIPALEAYINKLINYYIPAQQELVKA